MAKRRVIIDTDPGVDDAQALLVALGSPELLIEGLTIVFGNHHDLELLSANACRILEMAEREIPVYKGVAEPLTRTYHGHSGIAIHGDDGFGNLNLPEPSNRHLIQSKNASDFIVDLCTANPGEISIITLGPLTNLALALKKCPNLPKLVHSVVTMGGALNVRGNKTPVAEANINNDAEAARLVLGAGFQLTLVPLNVTRLVHFNLAFRQKVKDIGAPGKFIFDISEHYIEVLSRLGNNPDEMPTHDPSAVIAAILPDLFPRPARVVVDVECHGFRTTGMTVADWKEHWKAEEGEESYERKKIVVLLEANQAKIKEEILQRLVRVANKEK